MGWAARAKVLGRGCVEKAGAIVGRGCVEGDVGSGVARSTRAGRPCTGGGHGGGRGQRRTKVARVVASGSLVGLGGRLRSEGCLRGRRWEGGERAGLGRQKIRTRVAAGIGGRGRRGRRQEGGGTRVEHEVGPGEGSGDVQRDRRRQKAPVRGGVQRGNQKENLAGSVGRTTAQSA